jgi:hypothetical protein
VAGVSIYLEPFAFAGLWQPPRRRGHCVAMTIVGKSMQSWRKSKTTFPIILIPDYYGAGSIPRRSRAVRDAQAIQSEADGGLRRQSRRE